MVTKVRIKPSQYYDSVALMEAARELTQLPGVVDAAIVMATEANKSILREAGLFLPEIEPATANDLVIVVKAESEEAAARALEAAEAHLARRPATAGAGLGFQPRTVRAAARTNPQASLAVVSVAGQYAAAQAWEALRNGLHVLLFSDNVPIEEEVALKQYALAHGLLMMGAGCGTAIINGVALGFANAVLRGPVSIVAAAGTGLQEVSTLLAKRGVGIRQAIGTGGRDMHEQVGGITMLSGLEALQADPQTEVLVLVSKSPAPAIAGRVLEQVQKSDKPTVVCFLGGDPAPVAAVGGLPARTLQEAAYRAAAEAAGYRGPAANEALERESAGLKAQAVELKVRLQPGQRYLRGLFSGGTLAAEALVVWEELLGDVTSNVAVEPRLKLSDATRSQGHCAVDLGEDEFTVGRPHPMLDHDLRIRRLMQEASDPEVAVVALDVVLGYGAHPDPASELGPAIRQARERAAGQGRALIVVASVTGTEDDPQRLSRQVRALEQSGAVVAPCNAAAARLAGLIVA
ncbi:MAG TPA: acyl-CoA synthetase FdrA [Anaerolineae bacterium]|nr:acyl-CoA synthetase FdrA [Anaerolineae bacterium]